MIKHRRLLKIVALFSMVALATVMTTSAFAFHDSGSLICQDCHSMHYSEDGAAPAAGSGGPNPHLLYKKNTTDLCLMCHADPSKAPDVHNATTALPGGDFAPGGTVADANGHNPGGKSGNVSALIGLDGTLGITPPGGTGALTEFNCASCHGPHGGANECFPFRNLNNENSGSFPASSIESTNTEEASIWSAGANVDAMTAGNHNVYKLASGSLQTATKGFGAWCGTCHGSFHGVTKSDTDVGDGTDWIRHPTGTKLSTTVSYQSTTYDPTYPVETSNTGATKSANWTISAQTEHQVMCLSCHKAHASTNANAGRWDFASASGTNTGCNFCHHKGA